MHKGKYDKETKGICGVKLYWIEMIPELTISNINTLKGGELVLNYLIEKHKGSLFKALKDYKGSVNNLEPVHKTLSLYKELQSR